MERRIIEAVARVDVILCTVLRWLAVLVPLAVVLALAVLVAHHLARADPPLIDYDKPGVDITSEGPELFTDEWYKWR